MSKRPREKGAILTKMYVANLSVFYKVIQLFSKSDSIRLFFKPEGIHVTEMNMEKSGCVYFFLPKSSPIFSQNHLPEMEQKSSERKVNRKKTMINNYFTPTTTPTPKKEEEGEVVADPLIKQESLIKQETTTNQEGGGSVVSSITTTTATDIIVTPEQKVINYCRAYSRGALAKGLNNEMHKGCRFEFCLREEALYISSFSTTSGDQEESTSVITENENEDVDMLEDASHLKSVADVRTQASYLLSKMPCDSEGKKETDSDSGQMEFQYLHDRRQLRIRVIGQVETLGYVTMSFPSNEEYCANFNSTNAKWLREVLHLFGQNSITLSLFHDLQPIRLQGTFPTQETFTLFLSTSDKHTYHILENDDEAEGGGDE